jgi:hypothetical protein
LFAKNENVFGSGMNGGMTNPNEMEANKETVFEQIRTLTEFRCQGVTIGQAWTNYMSGDTVASVLVGDMMTVLNRNFTMYTDHKVQWYFNFESDLFQHVSNHITGSGFSLDHGFKQSDSDSGKNLGSKRKKRDDFMDQRLYCTDSGYGKLIIWGVKNTRIVVCIKSYHMHEAVCICFDHYGEKSRVFAKCISGGRPFDMVDIILMTQSS